MDFKYLRAVAAVAEAGSITKASKTLNIVQPALSNQLHQLESTLGTELFLRTSKGVQLTEAGEKFLIYAKTILKYSEHAIAELKADSNEVSGRFSIGCINGLANTIGVPLISELKHKYPKLLTSFHALGGTALQNSVVAAELDLYISTSKVSLYGKDDEALFSAENFSLGNANVEHIAEEEFFICSPRPPVTTTAARRPIIHGDASLEILESAPICLFSRNHAMTNIIEWLAEEHGLSIEHYGYANTTSIILDLVVSGECIALLPASVADAFMFEVPVRFQSLRDFSIKRDVVLCHADDLSMPDTTRIIKELSAKLLKSLLHNT